VIVAVIVAVTVAININIDAATAFVHRPAGIAEFILQIVGTNPPVFSNVV